MPRKSPKTKSRSRPRYRRVHKVRSRCYFCEKEVDPVEADAEILKRFLTRRGKIRPRSRSGLCARHQRRLSQAIKRGRNLGTIPYRIVA
ncbi:30S ribosomal protein S18 [Candidatus Saccharibacteria bacterium]|nr:30S ribosomal protein S18 [Candidatus Saccharibacteria bacterium]